MKNFSFAITFILLALPVFAQQKNDLKSYAYKNLKPSLKYNHETKIYLLDRKEKLANPEYKNYKFWKTHKKKYQLLRLKTSNKSKLIGPAYKNYKLQKISNITVHD